VRWSVAAAPANTADCVNLAMARRVTPARHRQFALSRVRIAFAAETAKSWLVLFARAVRPMEPRLLLRLEPFDEYSEMRGNRRRERVVLVFQSLTNCRGEVSVFSAREICIAWRCAGDNPLPNPMIDPISCGGDVAHVPVP